MLTPLILTVLLVMPYVVTRRSDVSPKRREWAGVLGLTSLIVIFPTLPGPASFTIKIGSVVFGTGLALWGKGLLTTAPR